MTVVPDSEAACTEIPMRDRLVLRGRIDRDDRGDHPQSDTGPLSSVDRYGLMVEQPECRASMPCPGTCGLHSNTAPPGPDSSQELGAPGSWSTGAVAVGATQNRVRIYY